MPYNIHDIGPARYAAEQQGRQDDRFRQLMNMFMMMKQMGLKREEFEQQQKEFQAMQPYYQARQQYLQAQAQPKPAPLPPDFAEYLTLRQAGFSEKESKSLAYNVKPEQKSQLWQKAKELYELQLAPSLQEAYSQVLANERIKRMKTPGEYKISRDEKTDFEKFLDTAMEAIKSRGAALPEEVDKDTQEISAAGNQRIANLQLAADTLRRIQAKVQLGDATQTEKALATKIYGNLSRVEKEGAFWEKPDIKDLQIPEFVKRLLEKNPDMTIPEAMEFYQVWKNKKK